MRDTRQNWAVVLRIFCAAALVFLSVGQPIARADERTLSASELAAYILPDGTLPEICITVPDGSGAGKIVQIGVDTSYLTSGIVLPQRSQEAGPVVRQVLTFHPPQAQEVLHHVLYPPGSGPRAPPAVAPQFS